MKKKEAGSIRRTITKVSLSDINEDIEEFENQMTSLDLGYTEEFLDDEGQLEYVKEIPKAKLRNFLAHPDLLIKFNAIRPHMALYCEYAEDNDFDDEKDLLENVAFADIYVTEVLLTGNKENSGVVLSGFKLLKDGNRIKLTTPNINLGMGEYPYTQILSDSLDELIEEARKAIVEKKCRVVQRSLFEEDEADADGALDDFKKTLEKNNLTATISHGGKTVKIGESAPGEQ